MPFSLNKLHSKYSAFRKILGELTVGHVSSSSAVKYCVVSSGCAALCLYYMELLCKYWRCVNCEAINNELNSSFNIHLFYLLCDNSADKILQQNKAPTTIKFSKIMQQKFSNHFIRHACSTVIQVSNQSITGLKYVHVIITAYWSSNRASEYWTKVTEHDMVVDVWVAEWLRR